MMKLLCKVSNIYRDSEHIPDYHRCPEDRFLGIYMAKNLRQKNYDSRRREEHEGEEDEGGGCLVE